MNVDVAEMKCKVFNELYPEGSKVLYFSDYAIRTYTDYEEVTIKSKAFISHRSEDRNKLKIKIKIRSQTEFLIVFLDEIIPILN